MMDGFDERVSSTLGTIWRIYLFETAAASIATFLLASFVLLVFGMEILLAFLPAAVIVLFLYIRGKNAYESVKEVEKGNPDLKDRLQAAYDNKSKDNFIVRELVREVSYELDSVDQEAFVDMGRLYTYVTVSIVSAFLLVFMLFAGFEGLGVGGSGGSGSGAGTGGQVSGGGGGGSGEGEGQTDQDLEISEAGSQDIFGDASTIRIEGDEIDLEIHPGYGEGGGFGSWNGEDDDRLREIQSGFIQATAAGTYTENIPIEMEGVVRSYFERISQD